MSFGRPGVVDMNLIFVVGMNPSTMAYPGKMNPVVLLIFRRKKSEDSVAGSLCFSFVLVHFVTGFLFTGSNPGPVGIILTQLVSLNLLPFLVNDIFLDTLLLALAFD